MLPPAAMECPAGHARVTLSVVADAPEVAAGPCSQLEL
jgi:hypothetical protein